MLSCMISFSVDDFVKAGVLITVLLLYLTGVTMNEKVKSKKIKKIKKIKINSIDILFNLVKSRKTNK